MVQALAVAAGVAAGGWNFSWKPLLPKFNNLNPLTGLGRMVTADHLGNLLKACFLALVLALIGGFYLSSRLAEFHDALMLSLPAAFAHTGQALTR